MTVLWDFLCHCWNEELEVRLKMASSKAKSKSSFKAVELPIYHNQHWFGLTPLPQAILSLNEWKGLSWMISRGPLPPWWFWDPVTIKPFWSRIEKRNSSGISDSEEICFRTLIVCISKSWLNIIMPITKSYFAPTVLSWFILLRLFITLMSDTLHICNITFIYYIM